MEVAVRGIASLCGLFSKFHEIFIFVIKLIIRVNVYLCDKILFGHDV